MDVFEGLSQIEDKSIDMIVTDPPFGMNWQSNWNSKRGKLNKIHMDDNLDWFQHFSDECYRVLKDNTAVYMFTRYDSYPEMAIALKKSGFKLKGLIVGQKNHKNSMGDLLSQHGNSYELLIHLNKGRRKFNKDSNVVKSDGRKGSKEYVTRPPNAFFDTPYNKFPSTNVNVSTQRKRNYPITHPSEKNVEFIEMLLKFLSNPNDIVLDPFMGSGTTAIACANLGRQYLGFEIDENYIELAKIRLENEVKYNKENDK